MNYSEIVQLVKDYTDRPDTETANKIDNFISIVEARVNKKITTMDMTTSYDINVIDTSVEFSFPSDYAGMRFVELVKSGGGKEHLTYLTPSAINGLTGESGLTKNYYTIVGNKIRIPNALVVGDTIRLDYYKRVPNLSSIATTNWLSIDNPDCYVFGLCVEVSAFWKDLEAVKIWELRFKESLDDIVSSDVIDQHSGEQLVMTLG